MAIQAQRDKKRSDDLQLKINKKQSKLDETARAKLVEETRIAAIATSSAAADDSTTPVDTANDEQVQVVKKRAGKFKCVGGFCQAESCKSKALGWTKCPKCDAKVCPKPSCQASMAHHTQICPPSEN